MYKAEFKNGEIKTTELTKEELEKMPYQELVDIVLMAGKKIEHLEKKINELDEKNEEYKAEITRVNNKAERRKKEATYQRKLITLYKRLLEKLTGCEGDF